MGVVFGRFRSLEMLELPRDCQQEVGPRLSELAGRQRIMRVVDSTGLCLAIGEESWLYHLGLRSRI